MAQINLFRIRDGEVVNLSTAIRTYEKSDVRHIGGFEYRLWFKKPPKPSKVSWGWVFKSFGSKPVSVSEQARGCVLIKTVSGAQYAVSFGGAHFDIDKFADIDFPFDFARRLLLLETKLTATVNVNSKKNRTISSFRNLGHLEVNNGEAYTKLKFRSKLDAQVEGLSSVIEVGGSLRFTIREPSLDKLGKLISFIEKKITGTPNLHIPRFRRIADRKLISELDKYLEKRFRLDDPNVVLTEFDVVGNDLFFRQADAYRLTCGNTKEECDSFDKEVVGNFLQKNHITNAVSVLDTTVDYVVDGKSKSRRRLRELVDYVVDDKSAVLLQGVWYCYNSDYISFLHRSLADLRVEYDPQYDFSRTDVEQYQRNLSAKKKNCKEYAGLSDAERLKKIRLDFYRERVFNLWRKADKFKLGDRVLTNVAGSKVEQFDLKKGDKIFSVKIGDGSAALSYVVTQSETVVDLIQAGCLPNSGKIRTVVLWIVFTRAKKYKVTNHALAWGDVNMLLLKNMISNWKSKVQLAGMQPEVWINYMGK